jgi:HK97 family phage major capsid protein
MAVELTHKQAVNREKDIQDELERLKAKTDKTPEDHAAVSPLLVEFREVHAHRLDLEHDAALAEVRAAGGTPRVEKDADDTRGQAGDVDVVDRTRSSAPMLGGKYRDPWNLTDMRYSHNGNGDELRARAFDAIERMPHATDKVREISTRMIENDGEETPLARMVLATTSTDYTAAFTKVVRSKGQLAALSGGEQQALSRAMSLTDADGGFLVPFQLDPTVILTANGSFNQVRQIARVVQATGDVWHGISSAGVTGSWDGEGVEVSDDSPTLAQPAIPVYKGDVFVAQSFEVSGDAPSLAAEIAKMIAFEKDRMESVSHVTGSGSGQPTGLITALVAAGGSTLVTSTTTDTFAVGDVYKTDDALPARFAANGSWLAHRSIYNKMRQFDTNGGSALWGQLGDARKGELLGRPDYVAEAMDGTITALAENYVLAFGDFQNYVVVDRVGTTLSYIPHLFGASGRPTGQSGWYAHFRSGGGVVNPGAFRLLNVT